MSEFADELVGGAWEPSVPAKAPDSAAAGLALAGGATQVISAQLHVVFVNHNSSEDLGRACQSLPHDRIATLTIVDNASAPADAANLRRVFAGRENTRLLLLDENIGFGAAANLAFERLVARDEDLVWLLNPDIVASEAACTTLANAIETDEADLVAPLIWTGLPERQTLWFAGGLVNPRRGKLTLRRKPPAGATKESRDEHAYLSGAAIMMRAGSWRRLGGFREDLFLYWEDVELCLRASALGLRIKVLPQAAIWHRVGGSGGPGRGKTDRYHYYMQRNRLVVCAAYRNPSLLVLGPGSLQTLRFLWHALSDPSDGLGKAISSLRGLRDGLRATLGRGEFTGSSAECRR